MKYQVFISPGDIRGLQQWNVRIVFPCGAEEQNVCKTETQAELWIGERIMAHAANYLQAYGAAEMADYV